jgi:MoxR-like ATPase
VEDARRRLLLVEDALNRVVIGRGDVVRALMLALASRQHIAIIGPPGTAKTYLAVSLSKFLKAKYYVYLMTKYTNYEELFGGFDIAALLQKNELRRKWSSLLEADLGFLDEIFKANGAILNSLLSLLQERRVYDPVTGEAVEAKLWSLIGASNEVPAEEELQAVYDRFAIRLFVDYLNDDEKILAALKARWQSNAAATTAPLATMEDVRILHEYTVQLLTKGKIKSWGEITMLYFVNTVPLLQGLRAKGIIVSDRTIVEKAALLYAAELALYGVTVENVVNAALDIVQYLARTPQEQKEIKKVIEDSLGEVAELARKLEDAERLLARGQREAAVKLLTDIAMYDMTRLASRPWLRARVEAIVRRAQEYLRMGQP